MMERESASAKAKERCAVLLLSLGCAILALLALLAFIASRNWCWACG